MIVQEFSAADFEHVTLQSFPEVCAADVRTFEAYALADERDASRMRRLTRNNTLTHAGSPGQRRFNQRFAAGVGLSAAEYHAAFVAVAQ
jgi:hypothetical protein